MKAFISYSTIDKLTAGKIQNILDHFGIPSFLAHEDIKVSSEWQTVILNELAKSDLFVALLSRYYEESPWCVQEAGIAAFREMTLVFLSLDGTIPKGFVGKTQSAKIREDTVSINDLIPGIIRCNFRFGTNMIIDLIGRSRSFRQAERNFQLILPYVDQMKKSQIKELLRRAANNRQVYEAGLCKNRYIPSLLKDYKYLLPKKTLVVLEAPPISFPQGF
ncbi:toll/interleukin-1 receptor domain-containing protein [Leptospira yasudae]|uniref:toll/interleukin-1 receptor domain-containing protein n=1 Tax=Leptospira yasudae TaxID=2202201 RepID=UPI001083096D|nr:toll/interleukin-1 receptor domain-containing protein [Leptospira yasudae]TGK25577.1 toll/interleukin-1 receptor domain-containing protein [Leptospira yasudae]TGM02676.1 toll/interleukin-1 receptor domain-containing protein [Leptospira yasudae]